MLSPCCLFCTPRARSKGFRDDGLAKGGSTGAGPYLEKSHPREPTDPHWTITGARKNLDSVKSLRLDVYVTEEQPKLS